MYQISPSHSPTVVTLLIKLSLSLKDSWTYTSVALQGPALYTLMTNLITSDTPTSIVETFTVLLICKSNRSTAVILAISALLLDRLVSFSVLFTTTTFEIVPGLITFAVIVKTAVDLLVRLPIYHIPSSTS